MDGFRGWLLATLGLFFTVTAALIVHSDFLPYGTDNNETFSSLLHARNMANNGFLSFYGLTNETTSTAPAAQAFIYTHQGNFPRLFAYVLYRLGAQTAESQIVITTATVGTLGIALAYIYMAGRVSPLFGFIFCAVLITDYVMSLQWLVNTWRVWHLPFFFAPLLLAHRLSEQDRPSVPALLTLLLVFACLFYLEIVYAFFVSFLFAFYLAFLLWRRPARLLLGWTTAGAGAVAAITLLILQIVGQLGWDGFVKDFTYTFLARNQSPAEETEFRAAAFRFMLDNNIVFWGNFAAATPAGQIWLIETIARFVRHSLLPQSPLLAMLGITLTLSLLVRTAMDAIARMQVRPLVIQKFLESPVRGNDAAIVILPAFTGFACAVISSSRVLGITQPEFLVISGLSTLSFMALGVGLSAICVHLINRWLDGRPPRSLSGNAALMAVILTTIAIYSWAFPLNISLRHGLALFVGTAGLCAAVWLAINHVRMTVSNVLTSIGLLVTFVAFVALQGSLAKAGYSGTHASYYEAALDALPGLGSHTIAKLIVLAAAAISILVAIGAFRGLGLSLGVPGLLPYIAAGALAYLLIAFLTPGYLQSGYQWRNCPFALYFSALFPACAIYVLVSVSGAAWRSFRDRSAASLRPLATTALLALPLTAAFVLSWLLVQFAYLKSIPPQRIATLMAALSEIGGTSIVNNYATPVALRTGQWSYYDPVFFMQDVWFDGKHQHPSTADYRYLWFADGKTNPSYRRPEYFVCWMNVTFHDVISKNEKERCGNLPAIRRIRDHTQLAFQHEEVARDHERDLWAIVKIDWGDGGAQSSR